MQRNKQDKIIHGALLLTLAGLVSKVLSAGYRIPLQNLTGDIGFYVYQQIYPLLGIIIVLALYGFPSAVSKITADMQAKQFKLTRRSFYFPILLIMIIMNGFVFIVIFLNASLIATIIGDIFLEKAYKLAAVVFLFIPFIALLRGVFQGMYNMKPTAYSQVGEQVVRISLIVLIAYLFFSGNIGLYQIGEGAAIASMVGMGCSLLILVVFLLKQRPYSDQSYTIPWMYYLKTIFVLGVVASLNHMVLLLLQFADVFTLVPQLINYGLAPLQAMEFKGVFDRGQPLIQIGTVLGSSFALAVIPSITKQSNEQIRSALAFSMYLAIGATIGLIALFPQVNQLLYQDLKGTSSLQILVIAILLSSFSITVCAILQGLGAMKRTALFIGIALLVKYFSNVLLVPLWGITGSALATNLSLLTLCILAVIELNRQLPTLNFFKTINWLAIFQASVVMLLYLSVINYFSADFFITSRLYLLIYILFVVITGAMVYLLLLLKGKAFTEEQLQLLPFSTLLIRLSRGGS